MAISGTEIPNNTMLLAQVVDSVNLILWSKTEDGQKGCNRPQSVVEALTGVGDTDNETVAFSSVDDFEQARERIINS